MEVVRGQGKGMSERAGGRWTHRSHSGNGHLWARRSGDSGDVLWWQARAVAARCERGKRVQREVAALQQLRRPVHAD